jgi:YVTN family beta-propeller protein
LALNLLISIAGHSQFNPDPGQANQQRISMPYNRFIQPAGLQIYFGDKNSENHALDAALSPDGKWLAVEERFSVVIINVAEKDVVAVLDNDNHADLMGGMNTYSGIIWHKGIKGMELYWSAIGKNSRSYVVSASWNGANAQITRLLEYKANLPWTLALPNEILIQSENFREVLYVVLNGNNKVIKQDLVSGDTIWMANTGVAPYGLTMASGKLYVTNWAGRIPESDDKEVAGVPWGSARVDNNAGGGTREGSVSVIDPATGKVIKEILVGLHPNDITCDKTGKFVYITNSNSDNVSVINTSLNEVSETISVRLQSNINPFFGDSPDGLCLSPDNKTLYVANGMDNALAVINLGKKSTVKSSKAESSIIGFIPTGAYPASICISRTGYIYVCNLEGSGARLGFIDKNTKNIVYNSHRMLATISRIQAPGKQVLQAYTDTVVAVNNLTRAIKARQKPWTSVPPKPVPDKIGEPSVFKHVVYIIKENRTYDEILGDMKQGDGDPGLCLYGAEVTPNTHKLSEEFMLLDNFNVSGKCSAEGHQWTDASIVTDYIEKNIRAWFRSYPHVQTDALVYAPTGFIWDNALRNDISVRIYGEASSPVMDEKMQWSDIYRKYKNGEKIEFSNSTTIDPVRTILSQSYPAYGNFKFPDVMRADALIKDITQFDSMPGDELPELMVVALPNDHTIGLRPGFPTPRAFIADNDYALGKIVEAFSKSRFWNNTVIFVVEDDSQNGVDHVSAYRTVSLVISPYSRLKSVNHTYYTQPSMVRTIEQILGMPPMNIQDAIANPMTECFAGQPDYTTYTAIPNKIPLDEMNAPLHALTGKALHYAKKSMLPEFDKVDSGNDDLMNRILWFAAKGNIPYPVRYSGTGKSGED